MDKVPGKVVLAHGSHLRFIQMRTKNKGDLPLAIAIISSTLLLNELTWDMQFTKEDNTIFEEVQSAFGSLSRLHVLHLENWIEYGANNLARILNRNSKLKEVVLCLIVGVNSLGDFRPLVHLTTLRLECSWKTNSGLIHLPQYCPNLTILTLLPDPVCPVLELFVYVKDYCPKLTALERAKNNDIDADEMEWTQNMDLALVRSTSALAYLDLPFSGLTEQVCRAILDLHSDTLETLRLHPDGHSAETFCLYKTNPVLKSKPQRLCDMQSAPRLDSRGMLAHV